MGQGVCGEYEVITGGDVSEAPWDTAETSLHIMESGGGDRDEHRETCAMSLS